MIFLKKVGISLYFSVAMFYFLISFFLPLTSKVINNGFYIGIALPALIYAVYHRLYKRIFVYKYLVFVLAAVSPLLISTIQLCFDFVGPAFRKFDFDGLYIALFLLSVVICKNHKVPIHLIIRVYVGVLLAMMVVYGFIIFSGGGVGATRLSFSGQATNPVYAGCLVSFGLAYSWLFIVNPRIGNDGARKWLWVLFLFAGCFLLIPFLSRSPIVGFLAFGVLYSMKYRALRVPGLISIALIGIVGICWLYDTRLIQGGTGYRIIIWSDALDVLWNECNLFLGCGSSDYKFAGKYAHPHSAYIGILYKYGLIPFVLICMFLIQYSINGFRRDSLWFFASVPGLVSLLFTTNGIFSSPSLFWIYFWLPVLLSFCGFPEYALRTFLSSNDRKIRMVIGNREKAAGFVEVEGLKYVE